MGEWWDCCDIREGDIKEVGAPKARNPRLGNSVAFCCPFCVRAFVALKMGSRGLTKQAMLFNKSLLQYLACPLSKSPLRYCEKSQELVSDTLGVAYPIIDGVPCLIPMRGRILDSSRDEPSSAK